MDRVGLRSVFPSFLSQSHLDLPCHRLPPQKHHCAFSHYDGQYPQEPGAKISFSLLKLFLSGILPQ